MLVSGGAHIQRAIRLLPEQWDACTVEKVTVAVTQALALVSTDIGQLHSQLPELNLKEWAAAATEQAVRAHVAAAFKAVEERVNAAVQLLYSKMADAGGSMGEYRSHLQRKVDQRASYTHDFSAAYLRCPTPRIHGGNSYFVLAIESVMLMGTSRVLYTLARTCINVSAFHKHTEQFKWWHFVNIRSCRHMIIVPGRQ